MPNHRRESGPTRALGGMRSVPYTGSIALSCRQASRGSLRGPGDAASLSELTILEQQYDTTSRRADCDEPEHPLASTGTRLGLDVRPRPTRSKVVLGPVNYRRFRANSVLRLTVRASGWLEDLLSCHGPASTRRIEDVGS
jgi:hypothetical protein